MGPGQNFFPERLIIPLILLKITGRIAFPSFSLIVQGFCSDITNRSIIDIGSIINMVGEHLLAPKQHLCTKHFFQCAVSTIDSH